MVASGWTRVNRRARGHRPTLQFWLRPLHRAAAGAHRGGRPAGLVTVRPWAEGRTRTARSDACYSRCGVVLVRSPSSRQPAASGAPICNAPFCRVSGSADYGALRVRPAEPVLSEAVAGAIAPVQGAAGIGLSGAEASRSTGRSRSSSSARSDPPASPSADEGRLARHRPTTAVPARGSVRLGAGAGKGGPIGVIGSGGSGSGSGSGPGSVPVTARSGAAPSPQPQGCRCPRARRPSGQRREAPPRCHGRPSPLPDGQGRPRDVPAHSRGLPRSLSWHPPVVEGRNSTVPRPTA